MRLVNWLAQANEMLEDQVKSLQFYAEEDLTAWGPTTKRKVK